MKSLTLAAAVGLVLALPLVASPAFAQCASCGACGKQAMASTGPVKLASLSGDSVDLALAKTKGPKVLFTFTPDTFGRKAVQAMFEAWTAYGDSRLGLVGVFCGSKKQAQSLQKEYSLSFPILLDQGCAGQTVLGLEKCPGAVFVNDAGRQAGVAYEFQDELLQKGIAAAYETSTAVDPVCGMTVDKETALKHVYQGKTYYFCSQRCRDAFAAKPGDYLND